MGNIFLLLFIGITAASSASIFIKLCNAPPLIISAYRMILASLILAPFAIQSRFWRPWKRADFPWLLLSGLFLSLHFAFWIASLKHTSVASSVILASTHPIFVGLGSRFFLGERLKLPLMTGIALSLLGSILIGLGDVSVSKDALRGDALALLGAVTVSGYFLVGRRMRTAQGLLLPYIFPVYATAGAVLALMAWIRGNAFFGYPASSYTLFLLLALIPQLIGHTTFNWALKYIPASFVALIILGEPVGSTLLAYFILSEGLTVWKVAGGILILTGILTAAHRRAHEEVVG
jgi:drug/metabolite transporter (DMT)-like permease